VKSLYRTRREEVDKRLRGDKKSVWEYSCFHCTGSFYVRWPRGSGRTNRRATNIHSRNFYPEENLNINPRSNTQTQDYRTKRDVLSEKQEAYNKSMDSISKLTEELAQISERLESIKVRPDLPECNKSMSNPRSSARLLDCFRLLCGSPGKERRRWVDGIFCCR
jgi:hypothetical protein